MKALRWLGLALLALLVPIAQPAEAVYQFADITCQPSTSTGTGALTLSGASGNYLPFATTITSGRTVPYGITASNGKVETGEGVFTSPNSLTRVANIVSTDGVGTKLSLPAGTHTVCVNFTSATFADGDKGDILVSGGFQTWNLDLAQVESELEGILDLDDLQGNLSVTHLNFGTAASASTYWRGDGTWATPGGSGNVSNTGTPLNDQLAVWTASTVIEGDPDLKFDTTTNTLTVGTASGSVIVGGSNLTALYQPLDADLTSWAAFSRATGFDAFATATTGGTSALFKTLITDEIGTGTKVVFATTLSGNTTQLATSSGVLTNGDCVSIDASGNFVAAGGACTVGGGGGTVNAGTAGQMAYYATSTNAVSGNANVTISTAQLTLGVPGTAAGTLRLSGATSGMLTLASPAASSGTLTFPAGTTNFTATGGASFVVQQASAGAALTVSRLACADLSNSTALCSTTPGTNVATFLATPTSANLGAAITDDTFLLSNATLGSLGGLTLAQGDILYATGAGAITNLAKNVTATRVLANTGTTNNPAWAQVPSNALAITTTTCTNQFLTAIAADATGTCTTDTLASAQHANQGTTTTVLHGNAAGNPSFAAVAIGADVSGLGTGVATFLGTPSSANLGAAVTDDTFLLNDAEVGAIASLTSAADRLPYFTGSGTAALATFTTYGRSLVDDVDAATARGTLGLATTSTDTAIVKFSGTAGATQNSGWTISSTNVLTDVTNGILTVGPALVTTFPFSTNPSTTQALIDYNPATNHVNNATFGQYIQEIPAGSLGSGPGAADIGQGISVRKLNWNAGTALAGEVDGWNCDIRQSGNNNTGSDASCILGGVRTQFQGAGAFGPGTLSQYEMTSEITNSSGTMIASVRNVIGGGQTNTFTGYRADSQVGALGDGVWIDEATGTWAQLIRGTKNSGNYFTIGMDGSMDWNADISLTYSSNSLVLAGGLLTASNSAVIGSNSDSAGMGGYADTLKLTAPRYPEIWFHGTTNNFGAYIAMDGLSSGAVVVGSETSGAGTGDSMWLDPFTTTFYPNTTNTGSLGRASGFWGDTFTTKIELGSTGQTIDSTVAGHIRVEGSAVMLASDIGSVIQAWDTDLDAIAALTKTKGNLISTNGTSWSNLAVGADATCLIADSAQTLGIKWGSCSGGGGGIAGSTGATDNRILRSDGTGGSTLQNSLITIDDSGNITPATLGGGDLGSATLPFGDLYLADDTTPSHSLKITDLDNLTAARTLSITTGDASRTITLSGNPTLNDWFDQSVKTTASPTFVTPTVTSIELAAGTANTLTAASGTASIEGNIMYRAGGTDVAIADGGTGQSTAPLAFNAISTAPTVQVFTTGSGTWTKPTNAKWIKVTVIGGGGGGGGGAGTASTASISGGGGGGGACIKWIDVTAISSKAYVVGAGGAGGAAGANGGTNGSTSSFDTTNCQATGGTGGGSTAAGSSNTWIGGGGGGVGTGTGGAAVLLAQGGPGEIGYRMSGSITSGGMGGNSIMGGGAVDTNSFNSAGTAGGLYGGGGGGGVTISATNRAGGAGGNGLVMVEEFY